MKYGESTFDVLYLVFAILTGIVILIKHRNKNDVLMGTAALVLGLGDSFHLVPRVLNYFIDKDFTWYLGFGKLVTSITMTIFYILVFLLYKSVYNKDDKNTKNVGITIYILAALRIALCLAPSKCGKKTSISADYGSIRHCLSCFIFRLRYLHRCFLYWGC